MVELVSDNTTNDPPVDVTSETALSEVDGWLKLGGELRQRLQTERAVHMKRVVEIDRALAAMPGEPAPAKVVPLIQERGSRTGSSRKAKPVKVQVADLRRAKVPQLVRLALVNGGRLMTAGEIIAAVDELRPGADVGLIHAALYRAKDITKEGSKGSMRYFLGK
jgi:hypothetical protein